MSDATNLLKALEPKSDQLNSDDLISGPITIRIRGMEVKGEGEQRISVFYEGDNGKPYKPGKSMGRVMVQAWGSDPTKYVGKSMTLYRDPNVTWGGMEVGGIRISHMSDLKSRMTFMLTSTKGKKKPYIVEPLAAAPAQETFDVPALLLEAEEAARKGMEAFKQHWLSIGGAKQSAIGNDHKERLKVIASQADAQQLAPKQPKVIINPAKINLAADPQGAAQILAEGLAALPEDERRAAFLANFGVEIAGAVTKAGGSLPAEFNGLI